MAQNQSPGSHRKSAVVNGATENPNRIAPCELLNAYREGYFLDEAAQVEKEEVDAVNDLLSEGDEV